MLKKLKSLFIVEDETTTEPEKKTASQSKPTTSPNKTATKPSSQPKTTGQDATPSPGVNKGKPDEKFINRLLGALEENNIEGFDYLEYKQSLQNLGGVEMDEGTKFKSALAMAKTMGATNTKLISSANHYLKILNTEEKKFLDAFKNQHTLQVNSRNKEIKDLEGGIAQRKAQIEKLQKEIEQGTKALEARKSSINEANNKVQSTKDNFYHSYNIVKNQIVEDIQKMQKYLS